MSQQRVGIIGEQLHRQPPGGIGVYIRSLLRALAEPSGHSSEGLTAELIVSRGLVLAETESIPQSIRVRTLFTPHRLTVELVHRGLPLLNRSKALRGIDLLHATSLDLLPSDQPLTAFVHDLLWRSWPQAYSARGIEWHERSLRRLIDRAQVLMVPSYAVARELVGAGAAEDSVHVVGEGSDHLPLLPRTVGDNVGQDSPHGQQGQPGPSGMAPYLLSVATAQPRKNLAGLLEGYCVYRSRHMAQGPVDVDGPLRLKLVGPVGWGPQLPTLPEGVEAVGNVTDEQLATLYAGAAALVIVPFAEGYGLPVVEAWRAGTPVLCSSGVPVGSEHADAALVVDDVEDAESIAVAIDELLADGEATARRVAIGKQTAEALTWSAVARRHQELWFAALRQSRGQQ